MIARTHRQHPEAAGVLPPITGHDLHQFFARRPEIKAGGMDAFSTLECKMLPECALDVVALILNAVEQQKGVKWPAAMAYAAMPLLKRAWAANRSTSGC